MFRSLVGVCTLNFCSGHTVNMFDIPVAKKWHGKSLVTLKLAVLWNLFLHYQWSKSPTFFKVSEWMTWCPTKFYNIAVRQFFWSELLRRNIENWAEFWCFKRFLWLSFFLFCQPRFQSILIVMNNYKKVQIHWFFYFYLPWRSFFMAFPRSNKKNGFSPNFLSNGSYFTRPNSQLRLDFAMAWGRNKIL